MFETQNYQRYPDSLLDYVKVIPDALSVADCDFLLENNELLADAKTRHDHERVHFQQLNYNDLKQRLDFSPEPKARIHTSFDILLDATKGCINLYRNQYPDRLEQVWPSKFGLEAFRQKHYLPYAPDRNSDHAANGPDRFDLHADVQDYASARRFLILFFYLTDTPSNLDHPAGTALLPTRSGSDLDLTYQHVITPRKGSCLIFPPFWLYPHAGLPVVEVSKTIVGTYLHYL